METCGDVLKCTAMVGSAFHAEDVTLLDTELLQSHPKQPFRYRELKECRSSTYVSMGIVLVSKLLIQISIGS